jgi:hypothetical protein
VKAAVQQLWERWQTEYAPAIIERRKWPTNDRNLQVGDVVAVMDHGNARGSWQIGRISRVTIATDGVVCSAWVLIPKQGCESGSPDALSELHRPAIRLALMEPAEVSQQGTDSLAAPSIRLYAIFPLVYCYYNNLW